MNFDISRDEYEILEDVLSEIQESRDYEGKDLKILESLKEKFDYANIIKFYEN